jgi:hypothetical protein
VTKHAAAAGNDRSRPDVTRRVRHAVDAETSADRRVDTCRIAEGGSRHVGTGPQASEEG